MYFRKQINELPTRRGGGVLRQLKVLLKNESKGSFRWAVFSMCSCCRQLHFGRDRNLSHFLNCNFLPLLNAENTACLMSLKNYKIRFRLTLLVLWKNSSWKLLLVRLDSSAPDISGWKSFCRSEWKKLFFYRRAVWPDCTIFYSSWCKILSQK